MTLPIYLSIADEVIALHTSVPHDVLNVHRKYRSFVVDNTVAKIPILDVWGEHSVEPRESDTLLEDVTDLTFSSKLWRTPEGEFIMQIKRAEYVLSGRVAKDWSKLYLSQPLQAHAYRYLVDRMIMIVYTMATAPLGYLKVHASVIELRGDALVFMGVSGTGKSTHSRLWLEHIDGAKLLNDDEPIIRAMPDGSVRVYGCPWSGSTHCYRNEWAEVKAFVHLYQASENKLTRLRLSGAFDSLFTSCAFMLSHPMAKQHVLSAVTDVLARVSVYRLDNRPDREAVALTYSLLN